MNARTLFQAGKLSEAITALGAELREDPLDTRRRTFLFELLCFAGDLERAEKQLDVLASGDSEAGMGALLYRTALHAERTRRDMFASDSLPRQGGEPSPPSGTLNGKRFTSITDADPRIGARLEVFAAGQYTWIPLEHVASVTMEEPTHLRDLFVAPARLATGPGFRGVELGEVLLPVLTPEAHRHDDEMVRLGRVTEWMELEDRRPAPQGQKLLLVDDEPVSLLEVRELEIDPPASPDA